MLEITYSVLESFPLAYKCPGMVSTDISHSFLTAACGMKQQYQVLLRLQCNISNKAKGYRCILVSKYLIQSEKTCKKVILICLPMQKFHYLTENILVAENLALDISLLVLRNWCSNRQGIVQAVKPQHFWLLLPLRGSMLWLCRDPEWQFSNAQGSTSCFCKQACDFCPNIFFKK